MTRANRVAINTTERGLEARFYRTHKHISTIAQEDTNWKANADFNATTNRESFRQWVCDHSAEFGILWNPDKAEQAWERKYNTYLTDEQVAEDTLTLIAPSLERLADKCKFDMVIVDTEVTAVTPKDSTLGYVTNGKYNKSGAWCVADIEVTVGTIVNGRAVAILYNVEMKSGQICKPKTTIAEWNEMVVRECELNGIILDAEVKTA
jgi:hypothetical protein